MRRWRWRSGWPATLAREPLLRHYVHHALTPPPDGWLAWRFDAAGLGRLIAGGIDRDRQWRAVDRVTAPTLLLRGQHSQLLSVELAAGVLRRLADGQLVEIPAAGTISGSSSRRRWRWRSAGKWPADHPDPPQRSPVTRARPT